MHNSDIETSGGPAPEVRLANFIRKNMDIVVDEWVAFASSHIPAGANMTHLALQDHIVDILTFIANDMDSPQTNAEQVRKSKGDMPPGMEIHRSAAETHAALRLYDGFNIAQMVSEYRALRASVIKLWLAAKMPLGEFEVNDFTRFNESIDQAITEAVTEYTARIKESRNMFLGILGHDLRNPIGAASMAAETLKRLSPPDSKQLTLASQIVQTTHRGIQILNDLLDVTRSAFGTDLPVVRAPMDIGRLGGELVDEMRSLAKGRVLEIDVSGDTQGAWDKARIGQVFSNLIGNAIEYSYPDSTVFVRVEGKPDSVVISVNNQGNTIPMDKRATIFDSLTRGDAVQHPQQGSSHLGLGLFITKKIVQGHGGSMGVASDESGTTFSVCLPRL